ncbi:MAG: helix-turn-helix domain-containing protein [Pseudomonadota bacterium]
MTTDTRELFLDKAEALFAERGFYGVSIAAIASELGLTKQALLHHFGSKERLYGEVLKRVSERFDALYLAADQNPDPADRFKRFMLGLQHNAGARGGQTALLIRELLDNKRRADTAGKWYLKPFLERLIAMVQAVPGWDNTSDAEALAFAYQVLGALNYYYISGSTLTNIFGAAEYARLEQAFPGQLERLIDATLEARSTRRQKRQTR